MHTLAENLDAFVRTVVREELHRRETEWRWLTPEQAGELLGLTPDGVRARFRRGQLPGRKLEGRVYIDRKGLDRLIASATVRPST